MKKALCMALLAGTSLTACVAIDGPPREPVSEREYITGSNLPRRASSSGVAVYTQEEAERMRDQQILPMDSPNRQKGP